MTSAALPPPLRWPLDLLLTAVETASWVSARALRAEADHFLGDIGIKVALGSPIQDSLVATGEAVIELSEALDDAAPGAPDSPEVTVAREHAVRAVQELEWELLAAQPSERKP